MEIPLHPFSLRQLQYAVAVADLLSFRKAAERCHVAQPSLSAQLAALEAGLGLQLFERNRRRVVVTAAGKALIDRARSVLREAAEFAEAARRSSDLFGGELRIGVIPTIAPYLLPEAVSELRAGYPRLAFVWVEEKTATLAEMLARGDVDAAIVALEAKLGDVAVSVLGRDPFVLAVAKNHRLAKGKRRVRLAEMEGERVLLLEDGHCFRDQALAFCSRAGAEEGGFRATSLPTLAQMAVGGNGVTLLPSLAVAVENRTGSLVIRTLAAPPPFRTLALVRRKNTALETPLAAIGETLRIICQRLVAG